MEWPKQVRTVNRENSVLTLDRENQFEIPELTMERLVDYMLVRSLSPVSLFFCYV